MKQQIRLILAAIVATLMGCGGGGSGSTSSTGGSATVGTPIAVSLTPASFTQAFPRNSPTIFVIPIKASVSGLPATPVFAYVIEDAQVITAGPHPVTKESDGSYTASLHLNLGLTVGTYRGSLTLKICADSACASPYAVTGGTLPYTITVGPEAQITATVNGSVRSLTTQTYTDISGSVVTKPALVVKDGETVNFQSAAPVQWSSIQYNTALTSNGFRVSNQTQTSTSWNATFIYGANTPVGQRIPARLMTTYSDYSLAIQAGTFEILVTK